MDQALDGCYAKLRRAKTHLDALQGASDDFREGKPVALVREVQPDPHELIYRVRVRETPPVEMATIIGDALYNLHSSLDHLAWYLAFLESRPDPPPSGSTFPIFKNRGRFWRVDNRTGNYTAWSGARRLEAMPEGVRRLIEEVQPYRCENRAEHHPLWLLHELSNRDKHSMLNLGVSAVLDKRLSIPKGRGIVRTESFEVFGGPIEDGDVVGHLRFSVWGEGEIEMRPDFAFNEIFAEGGPAGGRRILGTLYKIGNYIENEVLRRRVLPYLNSRPVTLRQS